MLGSPNRPVRDIFEFSCLALAHIFLLQFQPIREGRKIQREKQFCEFVTALKGHYVQD